MWCYRSTALKLELRRALQVSAEGFTERHIAAQLTEPQWLDRVDTAIARWPTAAATTYLAYGTSYVAPCGQYSSSYAIAEERLKAGYSVPPYSYYGPSSSYRRPSRIFY